MIPIYYICPNQEYWSEKSWRKLRDVYPSNTEVIIQPNVYSDCQARFEAHQRAWQAAYSNQDKIALIIESRVAMNISDQTQTKLMFDELERWLDKQVSWSICSLSDSGSKAHASRYYHRLSYQQDLYRGQIKKTSIYLISWSALESYRSITYTENLDTFLTKKEGYYLNPGLVTVTSLDTWLTYASLTSPSWIGVIGIVLLILWLILILWSDVVSVLNNNSTQ